MVVPSPHLPDLAGMVGCRGTGQWFAMSPEGAIVLPSGVRDEPVRRDANAHAINAVGA